MMDDHDQNIRTAWFGSGFGSGQVVLRFGVRFGLLCLFALTSRQPFWPVLAALLGAAAGLGVIMAAMKREPILAPTLTHWDEAAAYALLSYAASLKMATGSGG